MDVFLLGIALGRQDLLKQRLLSTRHPVAALSSRSSCPLFLALMEHISTAIRRAKIDAAKRRQSAG
jgi:hypothetical protein